MPLNTPLPRLRRPTVALVAGLTATFGVLSLGGAGTPASTASAATTSSGQTTVTGLLSAIASTFSSATTGWTAFAGGATQQLSNVGHLAAGALAVTSAGPWTGASSPRFAVAPGSRYAATSWVLGQSASHSVGLAFRFYDSQGNLLQTGTQVGQGLPSSTSAWTATSPVVGFAPAGAASGEVVFLDYDGPVGDVQLLDDLTVAKTTGVAAPIAAPLKTSGTQVYDRYGRTVTLHGIDIDGLQYTPSATATPSEVAAAQSWGANLVRIPLAENYVLPNSCGYDTAAYLSKVDALVNAATARGMVSLIDLHTNAVVPCAAPRQQAMPDQNATKFWQLIAARYKNNPLVAFDLYNEPHDVSDAVWRNGGAVTSGGVAYVAPGMQSLYNTVRSTGASNLVVASGTNWATAFPASAPLTGTKNLVYGVHAYTCPNGTPATGATCNPGPNGIYDPNGILDHFGSAAGNVPVMVSEFGFPDAYDGRYIANLTASVAARHWVGWSVYAFDGTVSGMFNLVKDLGPLNDPSISGMAVMYAMRQG